MGCCGAALSLSFGFEKIESPRGAAKKCRENQSTFLHVFICHFFTKLNVCLMNIRVEKVILRICCFLLLPFQLGFMIFSLCFQNFRFFLFLLIWTCSCFSFLVQFFQVILVFLGSYFSSVFLKGFQYFQDPTSVHFFRDFTIFRILLQFSFLGILVFLGSYFSSVFLGILVFLGSYFSSVFFRDFSIFRILLQFSFLGILVFLGSYFSSVFFR